MATSSLLTGKTEIKNMELFVIFTTAFDKDCVWLEMTLKLHVIALKLAVSAHIFWSAGNYNASTISPFIGMFMIRNWGILVSKHSYWLIFHTSDVCSKHMGFSAILPFLRSTWYTLCPWCQRELCAELWSVKAIMDQYVKWLDRADSVQKEKRW